ncbi:hypothetical protein BV25DRAFT_713558 [Artomyces pyxidatus]|uniref:Uncharacterized protein n=1 Tax=Artomyces pyxidatus TaxID=48021 RepID=A0ACB8T0K8_9AGAM|nr:hypothetical protein BV25DRAFT_713558 [Artomyces pyxidatus]
MLTATYIVTKSREVAWRAPRLTVTPDPMSTTLPPSAMSDSRPTKPYISDREAREEKRKRLLVEYACRLPMDQLPLEHQVSPENMKPTLVHFAIPIDIRILFRYADEHGLNRYYKNSISPNTVATSTVYNVVKRISKMVKYKLTLHEPFWPTNECNALLELYNNYTEEEKALVLEDEEDVINRVRKILGLGEDVRARWFFNVDDPWRPGAQDADDEDDDEEDSGGGKDSDEISTDESDMEDK